MRFVTVAAQIVLFPVELDVRALELREVHTTGGNNFEKIRGGIFGSSTTVLGTVVIILL